MENNRSVIITGAGAVLPWGSPSTVELTNLLLNDNVFKNNNNEPIGKYLFDVLNRPDRFDEPIYDPNFETMLYLIEMIYEYRKINDQMLDSFFRINNIFNLKDDINQKLLTFQNTNPNVFSGHFLDTALRKKCLIAKDYFYYQLFHHFIFLIKEKIDKFEKTEFKKFSDLNERFNLFLDSLKLNNGVIRFYTLNYDDLPVKISKISFFDGYNVDSKKIDVKRIINDNNVDCYYQLHGSFRLNFKGEISDNYDHSSPQMNFSNNQLIPTNIISGYNKLDRILEKPYFHFYNKLVDDCYKASQIFIIGYSFGDSHINAAINGAMQIGKAKLICIDRCQINSFVYKYNKTHPTSEYSLYKDIPGSYKQTYTTKTEKVKLRLNGLEDYLHELW